MASLDTLDGHLSFESINVSTEVSEPYVLSWNLSGALDGEAECSVLVLMKRSDGMLLVLPGAFLPEDLVERGNLGEDGAVFGPSSRFAIPTVIVEGGLAQRTGEFVDVLVVDCLPQIVQHMRHFSAGEEIIYGFDDDSPYALPSLVELLPMVQAWLMDLPDLAEYYTPAEEEEVLPATRRAKSAPTTPQHRRKQPLGGATSLGGTPKAKRVTTASLAEEMKSLMQSLPLISSQLASLSSRQDQMESRMIPVPTAETTLSRPLGAALESQAAPSVAALAKTVGQPPRTLTKPSVGLLATELPETPAELSALEMEKPLEFQQSQAVQDSTLAAAVLEQSRVLTALVAQIASTQSDPMTDLASSSSSGTRGTLGRAKLQAELAAHKGTFFNAVLQAISRRMAPTTPIDLDPTTLAHRGISGLKYLERFGGYSRQRELGQLQYQTMTAFDYLLEGNIPAAKDTIALLAVSIEQSCLDNGRMELATLLCLQEDPPMSVFQNRQISMTSRARSFAPLADQRWVTVALAYLKEMETISSKRQELTGVKQPPDAGDQNPKARPKGQPKRKGRGKGQPPQQDEAEIQ